MSAYITKLSHSVAQKINIRLVLFVIMVVLFVLGAGAPGATGV